MEIVLIIYQIISYITLLYGAYYVVSGLIGLIFEKKKRTVLKNVDKENYFGVIVAARNEEAVIGNLIDSLNNLNYNKEKYKTYIFINNTSDNTAKVVKEHGANAVDVTVPVKTKADVLSFAFDYLKKDKNIDAYIVFDADNVVHPDFLKHMNDVLNNGYRVATSFRDAKNPSDSWVSGSYTICYYIHNLFFCQSRMGLNGNANITGTGFMVKKEIVDQNGFNTYSLTEDMEFTGQCALKDEKIYYADKAITYDEYPSSFKTSWKQRKRWTVGNLQCMKLYSIKLVKNFFKTFKLPNLDMFCNFLATFSQILMVLNFAVFGIINILINGKIIKVAVIVLIISYLSQVFISVITIMYLNKKISPLWKGIVVFSLFIISWLPISVICLFKKNLKWEEIKHDRAISLEEIGNQI